MEARFLGTIFEEESPHVKIPNTTNGAPAEKTCSNAETMVQSWPPVIVRPKPFDLRTLRISRSPHQSARDFNGMKPHQAARFSVRLDEEKIALIKIANEKKIQVLN